METKQLTESETLTMQMVRDSASKKLVILSAGAMAPNKEGILRFRCLVEIDGNHKNWMPNKTTMKAIQAAYGTESENWRGKIINLAIGSVLGKEAIIGTPA